MKLLSALARILAQARDKGLRRSAGLGLDILRTQTKAHAGKTKRQFLFISHAVDNTGAPRVLTQAVEEFSQRYGPRQVHLVAPEIVPDQLERLEATAVRIDKVAVTGIRLVKLQLGLRRHDFVLMNTVAVREDYQRFILRSLRTGQLAHAFWFIHEDRDQLPGIAPAFMDPTFRRQLGQLIERGRLTILVPSKKMKSDYDELLDTHKVKIIPLKVDVDERYRQSRPAGDYTKIDFLISGTPTDGRKGQLIAVAAFKEFLKSSYESNPSAYRDFSLSLVGIGHDYVSQQIRSIGRSVLGPRLAIYPRVSHAQALEFASKCNAVICCSLNEAFGLYVAEGMAMGHVVLRNESGGIDEQLEDGVNGFRIDSKDVRQFATVIERMLNTDKTSDARLQEMGSASQDMIAPFRDNSYVEPLEGFRQQADTL